MIDFRGNEFGVGDVVLYPRMSGRSCEIQEGIVLELKPFEDTRWVKNPDYDSRLQHDRTNPIRIEEKFTNYRVRVQPTKSSRGFGSWSGAERKPVWIQIGENVVKG